MRRNDPAYGVPNAFGSKVSLLQVDSWQDESLAVSNVLPVIKKDRFQ